MAPQRTFGGRLTSTLNADAPAFVPGRSAAQIRLAKASWKLLHDSVAWLYF